jgi:hypothetical protein
MRLRVAARSFEMSQAGVDSDAAIGGVRLPRACVRDSGVVVDGVSAVMISAT